MTPAICFSRLDFGSAFCKIILMAYFAAIFSSIMELDRKILIKLFRQLSQPHREDTHDSHMRPADD